MRRWLPTALIALALLGWAPAGAESGVPPASTSQPERSPGVVHYALVVNGDDSALHRRNVTLALRALGSLGFSQENVYVLSGSPAVPQEGPPARYFVPTRATFKSVTKELAKRLDRDDVLVVYLSGHGVWDFGEPAALLYDEPIGARELTRRLLRVEFGRLIFVADTCYSGGFVEELARSTRAVIAVSSTDAYHEVHCAHFAQPFWKEVRRRAGEGSAGAAVSVREVYDLAAGELRNANPGEQTRSEFRALGRLAAAPAVSFVD